MNLTMVSEMPADLRAKLRNKRILFTVTTGRSGSNYLASLLSYLRNTRATHEPPPDFVDVMRDAQSDRIAAHNFWVQAKLPAIAAFPEPHYIETSHLFCKGFVEPLLALRIVPDIIILTRPARDVALSLYRIGTIPGRSQDGLKYLIGPDDPGVLPLERWRSLEDYQLCYWYCLEIERRARLYERMVREQGGKVTTVTLAEMTTLRGFNRLQAELDLPPPRLTGWLKYICQKGKKVNTKSDVQYYKDPPSEIDGLEREVLGALAGCSQSTRLGR